MDEKTLRHILTEIKEGKISISEGINRLKHLPYEDIGVARIDHHREIRHGIPEVIFAEGKDIREIKTIAENVIKRCGKMIMTRASKDIYTRLRPLEKRYRIRMKFHERSGVITAGGSEDRRGLIGVICAGTSDLGVAEEAGVTAGFLGSRVEYINDVGVAGLHRIADAREIIHSANVLIVVAGMEGALPSVIGGMTDRPIIAVPTSTGYGTSFSGLTALFAMLNSCVPGIAVMNIDNGFGAGVLAHRINILAQGSG